VLITILSLLTRDKGIFYFSKADVVLDSFLIQSIIGAHLQFEIVVSNS